MNEPDNEFWISLEHRVCIELSGLNGPMSDYWCDGFIPDLFNVRSQNDIEIIGNAWIGIGSRSQEYWWFRLFLPAKMVSVDMNWRDIIPPENMTGWLSMNPQLKKMHIRPANCRLDLPSPKEKR